MDPDLDPYQAELASARAVLAAAMAQPDSSVDTVAIARRTFDVMDEELLRWPYAVLSNFDGKADPQTGLRSEKYWHRVISSNSRRELLPLEDPDKQRAYRRLWEDYLDLSLKKLDAPFAAPRRAEDRVTGIVYLYRPNRQLQLKVMPVVAHELMSWFNRHPITDDFLKQPAERGFFEFLVERPDIEMLLRLIDKQPPDVTAYLDSSVITAKTQTAAQSLVETVISFVPLAGDAVAAFEAWSGQDLFGNPLDDLDRGILGATILLPMMGMLIKDARPVYSETRLVRLYGRTTEEWTHAIEATGRLEAADLRLLAEAEESLRLNKKLEPALARQVAGALPGVAKPAGLLQSAVDKAVTDALAEVSRTHPIMATLDGYALRRVLEKGPNPDLIKGQILEELIESRLLPWLADGNGYTALGLDKVISPGSRVVYVPGHMISDIRGRQLTDGILAVWDKDELNIVVVFEAKAGKSAARELRVGKGGLSSLSETERAELRAEAARQFRTLRRRAELEGRPFTEKLADIEKEVLEEIRFSETGGQVRRDVERLYEDVNGNPTRIWIGDMPRPVPVRISPTRTRFFGLLPAGVDPAQIVADLKGLGYAFEVIHAAITSRDLRTIGDRLTPIAARLAAASP